MVDNTILVSTIVHLPVEKAWRIWTIPGYIKMWNNASDDWHTPRAENNLVINGTFNYRMESKDGKIGFDFSGKYKAIKANRLIEYTLDDGRNVKVEFAPMENETRITEEFEAEKANSIEMQKQGWQAILDNYKRLCER
jgi:uncharacterized protein YndB with AHSA1/START domain